MGDYGGRNGLYVVPGPDIYSVVEVFQSSYIFGPNYVLLVQLG